MQHRMLRDTDDVLRAPDAHNTHRGSGVSAFTSLVRLRAKPGVVKINVNIFRASVLRDFMGA